MAKMILTTSVALKSNPGYGKVILLNDSGKAVYIEQAKQPHSNNFYELAAIYKALKFIEQAGEKEKCIVKTSSWIAYKWIFYEIKAAMEKEVIKKYVDAIHRLLSKLNVELIWEPK